MTIRSKRAQGRVRKKKEKKEEAKPSLTGETDKKIGGITRNWQERRIKRKRKERRKRKTCLALKTSPQT